MNRSISYDVDIAVKYGVGVAVLVNNINVFTDYHEQKDNTEYWHSMKDIATATGLSLYQVREAAKTAKEAGFIDFRQSYKPNSNVKTTYWKLVKEVKETATSEDEETATSVIAETATSIYKSKREESKRDIAKAIGDTPETFGNADINEMFEYWEQTIGYKIDGNKQRNRNACNNLIKKYKLTGLKQLVNAVSVANTDNYAPRISDFQELQSKLNQLLLWAKKKGTTNASAQF